MKCSILVIMLNLSCCPTLSLTFNHQSVTAPSTSNSHPYTSVPFPASPIPRAHIDSQNPQHRSKNPSALPPALPPPLAFPSRATIPFRHNRFPCHDLHTYRSRRTDEGDFLLGLEAETRVQFRIGGVATFEVAEAVFCVCL